MANTQWPDFKEVTNDSDIKDFVEAIERLQGEYNFPKIVRNAAYESRQRDMDYAEAEFLRCFKVIMEKANATTE